MIGGWLEHPVENLPQYFGNSELFRRNPYLLPTATAASVTFIGALLCLFLSYDGGPREGGIRLPEEKDMEQAVQAVAGLPGTVKKKVSGLFNNADTAVRYKSTSFAGQPVSPLAVDDADVDRSVRRQPSKTSFRVPAAGSAYGYSNARKLTGLSRYRALSMAASTKYAPDYEGDGPEMPQLNLAQRCAFVAGPSRVMLKRVCTGCCWRMTRPPCLISPTFGLLQLRAKRIWHISLISWMKIRSQMTRKKTRPSLMLEKLAPLSIRSWNPGFRV